MTETTDAQKSLIQLSSGARFYRCALQVNPPSYLPNFRGKSVSGDAFSDAQSMIDEAVKLGIEVIAVTNHNSIDEIEAFQTAARGRPVHVFPGFELSSSEGVHILCFYPPDTGAERLNRYLGEFGIHDTKPSSKLANKSFAEVLRLVVNQGGITIAAHVTNSGGLFKVLSGQARIQAWRDRNLLAIQIPGPIDDLPQETRQIVRNQNPDYRRSNAPAGNSAVAMINARDIEQPEKLSDPSATCYIKMQEVTIEGLQQAFLDPDSRVRLNGKNDDFKSEEHMEIVSVSWEGGFLDGVTVNINPNLNVFIGGRGTGKSTVIESIRSALGLKPIGNEADKVHDGIVRKVLGNGTKISLRVRIKRPALQEYSIERTIPNPSMVKDADGKELFCIPSDILPGIEVYGQHEISEIARNNDKLTRLLDRFTTQGKSVKQQKKSLIHALAKNRKELFETRIEIKLAQEHLDELAGLQVTLEQYRKSGLEHRLSERSMLERENQVLQSIPRRLEPFREALDTIRNELPIDLDFLSEKALEELPGRNILAQAVPSLNELNKKLGLITDNLRQALEETDDSINKVQLTWELRQRKVQAEYERILRELQKSRVDGEGFIELRRRFEQLRPMQNRLELLEQLETERIKQRRLLLAEWNDIKIAGFELLSQAAKKVNQHLCDSVHVEVENEGNREPLFILLREAVGGRMSETVDTLQNTVEFSLTDFVAACRSGTQALRNSYGITPYQAERLADIEDDVLMQMEELELMPVTNIRLNIAPKGQAPVWQALQDLSTGQKATAVLLLLLITSGAPLIVDQPEDDLDNRFITDGIVPRMREEKQRRQFIFSTHNANIPVLGDAELIVGLSAAGSAGSGRASVDYAHAGSIDSPSVRELVEEILEGGRDAFETRRRKYGF